MNSGSCRAQGADAAIPGARAAFIGGCSSTACTLSDEVFGVPAGGTMAHPWVQMFDSELDAFRTYCEIYPHNATLLIDTYNVLDSGSAPCHRGVRRSTAPARHQRPAQSASTPATSLTDSEDPRPAGRGWLADLQDRGFQPMDEYIIRELIRQGACIDAFGVGERLITAKSDPVFGGVYKLCAVEAPDGTIIPKIKISENVSKITTPHFKKVYRLRGRDTGKAEADLICLHDDRGRFPAAGDIRPAEHVEAQGSRRLTAGGTVVPVFRAASWYTVCPHCPRSAPALRRSATGCGRRYAASPTRTTTTWICPELWDIKQVMLNSRAQLRYTHMTDPICPAGTLPRPDPPAPAGMHRNHGDRPPSSGTRTPKTGTPSLTPSTTATFPV